MTIDKTALATAVAAALAAPAAQAYDIDVGENASFAIEGTVEPAWVDSTDNSGQSTTQLQDTDSTLQFVGGRSLGGDTRAFFHLEYQYDSNEAAGQTFSTDSTWVGLEGGFGMVRTGSYDTLYENNLHELIDPFEYASVSEEADGDGGTGEGNQVTYMSPGFGEGLSFAVETRYEGDGEGGFGGDGADAGSAGVGLSLVARYDAANWGVTFGTDNRGAVQVDLDSDGDFDVYDDEQTTGVGGYFDLGDLQIAGRYATESNRGSNNDVEYMGVGVNYGYGAGDVYAVMQDVSPDTGSSRTETSFGVKHGLYDSLSVFAEVGTFDRQNDAGDVTAIGAIYEF